MASGDKAKTPVSRSRPRKRVGKTTGVRQKNDTVPRTRATKRSKRLEATGPLETDESKMGQSDSARRSRDGRSRDVPKQLRAYSFKPGHNGGSKGRPKGSISLTSKLRGLLAKPAYLNEPDGQTKGDLIVEMAIQAAAQGDANFFKEIMNRVDGKVSDHVILDSAKRIVEQEAADVSAAVVAVTFEIVDKYIGDEKEAQAFITELGDKLIERLGGVKQIEAEVVDVLPVGE